MYFQHQTAERLLSDSTKNPRHALEVLRLIASMDGNNANPAIRQAAAVHFKNIVKKGWDTESEVSNGKYVIPQKCICW